MAARENEGLARTGEASARTDRGVDPHFVFRLETIRTLEHHLLARQAQGALMQAAATAVALEAGRMLRGMRAGTPVLLFAGPGNNGGDALMAGPMLERAGHRVSVFAVDSLAGAPPSSADAQRAWREWQPRPIRRLTDERALEACLAEAPLCIDGLFGIGLSRPLSTAFAACFELVERARMRGARVLSIDIPSGLCPDTASPVGGGPVIRADVTVTMIGDKPGLHTGLGKRHSGRIVVAPLVGLDEIARALHTCRLVPDGVLLDEAGTVPLLPRRSPDAHKGTSGHVLVVGGRNGMEGAARLASRGALAAGAGKVTIGTSGHFDHGIVDPMRPEIMRTMIDARIDMASRFDAVVVGCGLGLDSTAKALLRMASAAPVPLVIDADALTLLGADPELARRLTTRLQPTILTPHPLEAARLAGCTTDEIQRDRIRAALTIAARYNAIVILKGPGSVVANPVGDFAINTSGGPILASGGTGDVLAGIVAAFAATQGAARAACAGVWVHGAVADRLACARGDIGTPAAMLADALCEFIDRQRVRRPVHPPSDHRPAVPARC